jgi:hypothetical protein
MSSSVQKHGSHQQKLMAVGLLKKLDATTLLWAATVVRYRCHISNHVNANAQSGQRTNRRLTAWAWAFDFDIKVLDALLKRCTSSNFRSHLRGERS